MRPKFKVGQVVFLDKSQWAAPEGPLQQYVVITRVHGDYGLTVIDWGGGIRVSQSTGEVRPLTKHEIGGSSKLKRRRGGKKKP